MPKNVSRPELDAYAVQLIRSKAYSLLGKYGFRKHNHEDLEQDLTLELLTRLPDYDPTRSSPHTFASHIIDHGIARLIEARKAAKRDYRRRTLSLNEPIGGEEAATELGDLVDENTYLRMIGSKAQSPEEQAVFSVDVERARAKLPPELRSICTQLEKGKNVTESSQEQHVSRDTVYERIARIRTVFARQGLEAYI